jgi:hypothetical protein
MNRQRTLDELEGHTWGPPTFDSHLVTECHRLRKVPLEQFTAENLRIMIGQKIGLPHLVPLALERLEENPFTAGDYHPGDLLLAVLRVGPDFWHANPGLFHRLNEVMSGVESCAELLSGEVLPAWNVIK